LVNSRDLFSNIGNLSSSWSYREVHVSLIKILTKVLVVWDCHSSWILVLKRHCYLQTDSPVIKDLLCKQFLQPQDCRDLYVYRPFPTMQSSLLNRQDLPWHIRSFQSSSNRWVTAYCLSVVGQPSLSFQ
jgi:hypothetical protein